MIFISATDTDVGKTYFSSKILDKLINSGQFSLEQIAYYKPVQTGSDKDFETIRSQFSNIAIYNSYNFAFPASPDYASALENQIIDLEKINNDFQIIKSKHKFVIVEGAGGLAVPINENNFVADIPRVLDLEVVLIIRPDLGTINHSLLSLEYAYSKKIKICGIIVSERSHSVDPEIKLRNEAAIKSILKHSKAKLLDINHLPWI
jgi:dethiobiotin synthetase